MIISRLQGGLGNQMFQYSLGRYLAFKNKTQLMLDLVELSDKTHSENFIRRNYELNVFNIEAKILNEKVLSVFRPAKKFIYRILEKLKIKTRFQKIIFEIGENFDPNVLVIRNYAYLIGYWQSEKYFLSISNLIRRDFTIKSDILGEIEEEEFFKEFKDSIINTNSVSIHFRRGDFISDEETNKNHGICSEEYYHKAIGQINLRISDPHYFLFSDEPGWLEKNFKIYQPHTIIRGNKDFVDLHLMSLCKHNITANSSFSWWGAWLNNNPDKMVIAPKKWFANESLNDQTIDLIPDRWIRL